MIAREILRGELEIGPFHAHLLNPFETQPTMGRYGILIPRSARCPVGAVPRAESYSSIMSPTDTSKPPGGHLRPSVARSSVTQISTQT